MGWGAFSAAAGTPRRPRWSSRPATCASFLEGLTQALSGALLESRSPDTAFQLELRLLRLDEQLAEVDRERRGERILSLDACVEGDANLGVSRCFELCASGEDPRYVARPGWPSLERQVQAIPPGTYVLLDDDLATGRTLDRVLSLLPDTCVVSRTITLCRITPDACALAPEGSPDSMPTDLCDARDFLVGAREGGLVVALPDGTTARSPYVLPHVHPAERVSIPLSSEVEFSRRIWLLNLAFFESLDRPVRLDEASCGFRALAGALGFDEETSMEEVCRWHLARLTPGRAASGRAGPT